MIWTEALSTRIADLWKYRSATEIAEVLRSQGFNVSRNAVIGRLHRLKLTVKDKAEVHPSTNMTVEPRPKIAAPKVKQSRRSTAVGPQVQKINAAQRAMRGLGAAQVQSINRGPKCEAEPCELRTADVVSLRKTIVEVAFLGECKWPDNEPDAAGQITVCGHPTNIGSSWCEAHKKIVWQPHQARAKQSPFYRETKRRAA